MKKYLSLFFCVTLMTLIISCDKEVENDSISLETRSAGTEIDWNELDSTYFVTDKDIEAYIHYKKIVAEGEKEDFAVCEVRPLSINDKATLAYLINYQDGWEIIAADKRLPAVMASGMDGNLSLAEAPDNIVNWIESLELDVLYLRSFKDKPDWAEGDVWKDMLSNAEFWSAINCEKQYIELATGSTRGSNDPILIDPTDGGGGPGGGNGNYVPGHWSILRVVESNEVYMSCPRLTHTDWNQGVGFNQYCPTRTDGSGNRAFAGCSAVAAAQMLYYLHYKIGYPSVAPTNVYCNATVNNHGSSNYYTYGTSSTIWQDMLTDATPSSQINNAKSKSAVLISYAGIEIDVDYDNDETTCGDDDVYDMFRDLGINCNQLDYDPNAVVNQLNAGMPVVMYAKCERHTILGIPYYRDGHFFIIDRFEKLRHKTEITYQWDGGSNNEPSPNGSQTQVTTSYGSPYISYFSMNWGAEDFYNNYTFSPLGDWVVFNKNYQYKREMIINFSH